ncbi:MAG: 16S rRNA (cytidine(1402)-2'-O)-methyltransferase [Salibacteraceae bacterium]
MKPLTLVPTPIGNLKDITLRALETLKEADVILAEDTRQTKKLLMHFEIDTPMSSFHMHNEHKVTEKFINQIKSGQHIAMVSDAGTPGISDPGFLLVRACVEAEVEVEVLPGATAFVPAIVASGLPCDKFVFEGFLPHKKGRQKILEGLSTETKTIVFYESPHRLVKTLDLMIQFFGEDRQTSVSRELTKMFEEHKRGSLLEVRNHYMEKPPKGEIVIVVAGTAEKKVPKKSYIKYVDRIK